MGYGVGPLGRLWAPADSVVSWGVAHVVSLVGVGGLCYTGVELVLFC